MIYNKTNGVTFGDYHSYKDWGLLLSKFPVISAPEAEDMLIEVPGRDAPIDLSTALDGYVHYKNRSLTLTFIYLGDRSNWLATYSNILTAIHGKRIKVILDYDPAYYYYGTVKVNTLSNKKDSLTLTINVDAEPYKYEIDDSVSLEWKWDEFSFEDGVIRGYNRIEVNGEKEFTVIGSPKHCYPEFIVESVNGAGITVTLNGDDYLLEDGVNIIDGYPFGDSSYDLVFKGRGNVTIKFNGGRL